MCLHCCSCSPDRGSEWREWEEERVYKGMIWAGEDRRSLIERLKVSDSALNRYRGEERCWYCGLTLRYAEIRLDHVFPVRRGGSNEERNLAIACNWCNLQKGYVDVETWLGSDKLAWRRADVEAEAEERAMRGDGSDDEDSLSDRRSKKAKPFGNEPAAKAVPKSLVFRLTDAKGESVEF